VACYDWLARQTVQERLVPPFFADSAVKSIFTAESAENAEEWRRRRGDGFLFSVISATAAEKNLFVTEDTEDTEITEEERLRRSGRRLFSVSSVTSVLKSFFYRGVRGVRGVRGGVAAPVWVLSSFSNCFVNKLLVLDVSGRPNCDVEVSVRGARSAGRHPSAYSAYSAVQMFSRSWSGSLVGSPLSP